MREFLPAKPIASSDRMTHSESTAVSTDGESCSEMFTEEMNCSLVKRQALHLQKNCSLKARLVPHEEDWHLQ